jgi:hypothetical protein
VHKYRTHPGDAANGAVKHQPQKLRGRVGTTELRREVAFEFSVQVPPDCGVAHVVVRKVLAAASHRRPVKFGDGVPGAFTTVLAKHSKSFALVDSISIGVDRMQRNVEPMRKQIEAWRATELTDISAKMIIYERPSSKASWKCRNTSRAAFTTTTSTRSTTNFRPHTMWSLSNAFTSAFKELDAVP